MAYAELDFWDELLMSYPYDALAARVRQSMELDGQGKIEDGIVSRFTNALRSLDDADHSVLFGHIQKARQSQCVQDGVDNLRKEFVIIRRNAG